MTARSISWTLTGVLLCGAVLAARALLTIEVSSSSMEDSYCSGDRVLIMLADSVIERGRKNDDYLGRGDVIVFRPISGNPFFAGKEQELFIKRVIGVAGDHISLVGGMVVRNGSAINENYVKHDRRREPQPETWPTRNGQDTFGQAIVPERMVFVLGDHRDGSFDSRMWGFLPVENVVGTVLFRIPFPRKDGSCSMQKGD